MLCRNCGKNNQEDAIFCEFCGSRIVTEQPVNEPERNNYKDKKKTGLIAGIVVLVVCAICVAGYFVYRNVDERNEAQEEMNERYDEVMDVITDYDCDFNDMREVKHLYDRLSDELQSKVNKTIASISDGDYFDFYELYNGLKKAETEENELDKEKVEKEFDNKTESNSGKKYVANAIMKVRNAPGYEAEQVGRIELEEVVTVYEIKNSTNGSVWGRIGTNRWVCLYDNDEYYLSLK